MTTQRITEILRTIDEDGAQAFFKLWSRKVLEKDYLCHDITSVSSYSELDEIHSSAIMAGRFFTRFITLIYMSALRRNMRKANLLDKFTARELMGEMAPLTRIDFSGKYGHLPTEVSKTQRQIMESLGVTFPK